MPAICLILLFASIGWAQPVVEGVVVDDIANAPIPNALVQVQWMEPRDGSGVLSGVNTAGPHGFTGEDGRFRIEVETPAKFALRVTADGYISTEGGLKSARYNLAEGESKRGITVKLAVEASLEGMVYDPDLEKGVAGVGVQAMVRETMQGVLMTLPGGGYAKTDSEGRYRIGQLKPGSYSLRLQPPRPRDGDSLMYLQQVEPLPLEVFSGARLSGTDFKMRRSPVVRVSGRLVTADGEAAPAPVRLTVQRQGPGVLAGTMAQPFSGGADFTFIPDYRGSATLLAYGGADSEFFGSTVIEVGDKDLDGVEVVLTRGALFRGVVKAGEALPEGLKVLFRRERVPNLLSHSLAEVDPESGQFTRDWVHPVPAYVRVQDLPAGWVLDKVTYNGHALPHHRFEPDAGALDHRLELHIRRVSNGFGGRVLESGEPVAGAMVVALREPVDAVAMQTALRVETGEEGRYSFRTLRPGVWRVFAVAPGSLLRDSEGRMMAGGGEKVVLDADTVAAVDLKAR